MKALQGPTSTILVSTFQIFRSVKQEVLFSVQVALILYIDQSVSIHRS